MSLISLKIILENHNKTKSNGVILTWTGKNSDIG